MNVEAGKMINRKGQLLELSKELAIDPQWDRVITGLALDSRQVSAGDLFFAIPGVSNDGRQYIQQALEAGAAAILYQAQGAIEDYQHLSTEVPIIGVENLGEKVGPIAALFYHQPSRALETIAVTGTNGKTSTCHFLAQSLVNHHKKCGVIGTAGFGCQGVLNKSALTTPDPILLQEQFADFLLQGAKACIFEASSHGIQQHRLNGTEVDIAIFTNLTQDHLDYHGTMENYGAAKRLLFTKPGIKQAIINGEDTFGRRLINEFASHYPVYAYSTKPIDLDVDVPLIVAEKATFSLEGFTAKLATPWGDAVINSHLMGTFNLSNTLAVLTCLTVMGIPFPQAVRDCSQLKGLVGRMETFGGGDKPTVIVDFAHTPDALQQALSALKPYCEKKLICVFGCGGDREKSKRAPMGTIAEALSDQVIITNDNPRIEDPKAIVKEILQGFAKPQVAEVILDRAQAIKSAMTHAVPGDIILIAGKGHEDYQLMGRDKIPFSDHLVVNQLFNEGWNE